MADAQAAADAQAQAAAANAQAQVGGQPPAGQPAQGGPPPGGNPPAQIAQPNPVAFALSPATVSQTTLDYSTKHGNSIYASSTKELPVYDLSGQGLGAFLQNSADRASESGWTPTLTVPCNDGITRDLFEHYGTITLEDIRAHATGYLGTHTRDAQNSYQMQVCFKKSLTEDAKVRVESSPENYTINGVVDGPAYLKSIIQTAIVDTRFTSMTIREKLQALPDHMFAVDHNITQFNMDVRHWTQQLLARNDPMQDSSLNLNILHGYKACADEKFNTYIVRVYDSYLDGSRDFTSAELMLIADNKYKQLVDTKDWMEPSAAQQKIVALYAQIEEMGKGSKKQASTGGSPANGKQGGGRQREYPAWKKTKPKGQEPQTKIIKDKTYHWCPFHELWTEHSPVDCRKKPKGEDQGAVADTASSNLRLSQALANIAMADEGYD